MTAKTTTPVRYALTLLAGAGTLAALAACSSTATAGTEDAGSSAAATSAPAATSSAAPESTGSASTGSTATGAYADGTYEADGSYTSPGGNESVGVELTLESGVVTAVTVTPESENPTGQEYQTRFASGISGEVVGKSLDELDVTKVSGSSLTSGGFNDAVETIKADAAA
ncbi:MULTISPECIES: FMN-binding protein [unclassified Rathayibacter]|uniref:FMN-binding protein n=1 Tax=unclassified Rathayibacter TaxID=2609250 RepID=UPI001053AB59|nr:MULTISPECIES: FMN-binding protein [unclassified Rathayibacter]MCJ1672803.1 FMN-binding protein [Rathayibacter sp. VKM Ac-2929]MCJ1682282.1 FMN-binding protein [Rathayibacter sp. VKM Ac-2928]MCJ1685781.1 FMN-binding protein [Rathayibacter sp. VKM Ac-2927]MCJ1704851.1 FMN-binding protein [Rathayibacter sp. VKM Ac-2926]TCL84533.1 FMN-binding protein [Rathayibacter sp. PhB192]